MDRPSLVTADHLNRLALIYIRQSTMVQVRVNQGSTAFQREQIEFPRRWGWPDDRIVVIDEDLGRSGSTDKNRAGYRSMLEYVVEHRAGAIFSSDFSRLARSFRDSIVLVDECRIHNVLIVDNGFVHDLRNDGDRYATSVLLGAAELENSSRRNALYNGRLIKARQGFAVSSPPVGYVAQHGMWLKDPDESVRAAIDAIFRIFLEERSLIRTVARMVRLGLTIPRRNGPAVSWVAPDIGALGFMIRSPSYVGDYVFRNRRVDPVLGRSSNGRLRDRPSADDEKVVIPNHHDGYVSRNEWSEMQHILDLNAPRKDRRNLGPGSALLQGVIRCQKHRLQAIQARYKIHKDRGRHPYYVCQGDRLIGGSVCRSFPSRQMERAVIDAIAARLIPPNMEIVREAWTRLKQAADAERTRRDIEVDRLRQQVKALRRRYELVDPENRHVATDVERMLEDALRELAHVESVGSLSSPADSLNDDDFDELCQLCANFWAIWNAPTTADRDRKEIIRTMVESVIVEGRTNDEIQIRIVWADDAPDTLIVVKLNGYTLALILDLTARDMNPEQIAEHLNSLGLRTLKGREWSRKNVAQFLWHHRRRAQGLTGADNATLADIHLEALADAKRRGLTNPEAAEEFNARGIPRRSDRPWTAQSVTLRRAQLNRLLRRRAGG